MNKHTTVRELIDALMKVDGNLLVFHDGMHGMIAPKVSFCDDDGDSHPAFVYISPSGE